MAETKWPTLKWRHPRWRQQNGRPWSDVIQDGGNKMADPRWRKQNGGPGSVAIQDGGFKMADPEVPSSNMADSRWPNQAMVTRKGWSKIVLVIFHQLVSHRISHSQCWYCVVTGYKGCVIITTWQLFGLLMFHSPFNHDDVGIVQLACIIGV